MSMGYRFAGLACAAFVALPFMASAENAPAPDLSGHWVRKWVTAGTFDAMDSGPGPVMIDPSQPHHGHREGVTGQADLASNAWVADYSNPILKPEARAVVKKITDDELAGHSHLEHQSICMPSGVPEVLNLRDDVEFLQSPTGKEVTIIYHRDAQVRHVYMNVPHSKTPAKTWYGESVGHYDGNTFVVDTIGLNTKTDTDRFGSPHSEDMHVIERYTPSADRKTLNVVFTVDDPKFFTTQWSGRADYKADAKPYEEVVCAENNRAIGDASGPAIPEAAKSDF
jgi:hypothetical protein